MLCRGGGGGRGHASPIFLWPIRISLCKTPEGMMAENFAIALTPRFLPPKFLAPPLAIQGYCGVCVIVKPKGPCPLVHHNGTFSFLFIVI